MSLQSINKFTINSCYLNTKAFCLEEPQILKIKHKIENIGKPLKDWDVGIYYGIKTGLNEAFIIDSKTKRKLCKEDPKSKEIIKPILRGRDISRYNYNWNDLWLIFSRHSTDIKQYPAIYNHLKKYKKALTPKKSITQKHGRAPGLYKWYHIQQDIAYNDEFNKEKIIWQELTWNGRFTWDSENLYLNDKCYFMTNSNRFLLGILNSDLITLYLSQISINLGKKALKWGKQYVEQIPVVVPDSASERQMIVYVDKMLKLTKNKAYDEAAIYNKKIEQLVYKLYKLTPEEIEIIENDNYNR